MLYQMYINGWSSYVIPLELPCRTYANDSIFAGTFPKIICSPQSDQLVISPFRIRQIILHIYHNY